MQNFVFQNPTKLIFGKNTIAKIADQIPQGANIMVTFGGGSIKTNGVYDQVMAALKGRPVVEFGGIEANPDFDTLIKAVEICKTQKIDFLLAVGGGSIIDGTKFIATAVCYQGDPWEFLLDESKAKVAIPLASVLTLPATGSEMNCGAVISRRRTNEKFAFHNPKCYPVFSVLDPQVCYSLPIKQRANGIVDTYAHILEQYLTHADESMVMDRFSEGLLKTLIEIAPQVLAKENNYDTMANFMLTATMGLNGFLSMGVTQDWATHMIGHELTALHGLDHGVTLAIVFPGVMNIMRDSKREKLLQYGERVLGINQGSEDQRIDKAIEITEEFFRSVGMRTRLSEHGIGETTIKTIVQRFTTRGWNLGEGNLVTPEKVEKILNKIF